MILKGSLLLSCLFIVLNKMSTGQSAEKAFLTQHKLGNRAPIRIDEILRFEHRSSTYLVTLPNGRSLNPCKRFFSCWDIKLTSWTFLVEAIHLGASYLYETLAESWTTDNEVEVCNFVEVSTCCFRQQAFKYMCRFFVGDVLIYGATGFNDTSDLPTYSVQYKFWNSSALRRLSFHLTSWTLTCTPGWSTSSTCYEHCLRLIV